MTIWFISDLHLDVTQPALIEQCQQFLHSIQNNATAVYILGDLFEYWVGDDALDTPYTQAFTPVFEQFHALKRAGVDLYFLHGNRDFLIGEKFAETFGFTLLPEHTIVDLFGVPTLLLHGDTLCTDDVEYQKVRTLLRNPQWQQQALSAPIEARIQQAQALRAQSRMSQDEKDEAIIDANPQAVLNAFQEFGVQRIIHGHTHRPAQHTIDINEKPVDRIVLGDWHIGSISYLQLDDKCLTLHF